MANGHHIHEVVLVDAPRPAVALPGQHAGGALHVARREVEEWHGLHGWVNVWRGGAVAVAIHVTQQPADVFGGQVRLERPRCIGVAEGQHEIGHIAEHHAFVGHRLSRAARHAIHGDDDVAQHVQLQSGGHHHDVGRQGLTRGQHDAVLGETLDGVGHDRGAALADLAEQVAVWHQADALVPRLVTRREMGVDVIAGRKLLGRHADHPGLDLLGFAARKLEEEHPQQHVLPARGRIGQPFRQHPAQLVSDRILAGTRDDIRGRPLQHRHVGRGLRHGRYQRDGRSAASDYHHAFAGIVDRRVPELWMHHAATEVLLARKRWPVSLRVAVVAGADVKEMRAQADPAAIGGALGLDRPAGGAAIPGRADHLVPVADVLCDARLVGGLANVREDRRAIGNCLGASPGLEAVPQGVHVRVGADARVAEQIPGTAHGLPGFQDGVALAGAAVLQLSGGADTGQAGADDQNIKDCVIRSRGGHDGNPDQWHF